MLKFFLIVEPAVVAEIGKKVDPFAARRRIANHSGRHNGIDVFETNWSRNPRLRLGGRRCRVVEHKRLEAVKRTGVQRLDRAIGGEKKRAIDQPLGFACKRQSFRKWHELNLVVSTNWLTGRREEIGAVSDRADVLFAYGPPIGECGAAD